MNIKYATTEDITAIAEVAGRVISTYGSMQQKKNLLKESNIMEIICVADVPS